MKEKGIIDSFIIGGVAGHPSMPGESFSVAAIPQRGEWENGCECSVCGMAYGPRNEAQKKHYRFCPNCGARMEEESDE